MTKQQAPLAKSAAAQSPEQFVRAINALTVI